MTSLPSNISVELSVDCQPIGEPTQKHRIWIARRGEVFTPDHHNTSEEVAIALGGTLANTCSYWKAIPVLLGANSSSPKLITPNIENWRIVNNPFWTSKVCWTMLSGLTGFAVYTQLEPEIALSHLKVFKKYANKMNTESLINDLQYLQSPSSRTGGFRRNRITTPEELEDLINSGLPMNRVSSAATLDITAEQAKESVEVLKSFRLPLDLLINIAYSLPGDRIPNFMGRLTQETAEALPSRLSELGKNAEIITDDQIEDFLLGNIS